MPLSCTLVAGLLCFHAAFDAQPTITYHGDNIYARGPGWAVSYFPAREAFAGFSSAKGARACAGTNCLVFRRVCGQVGAQFSCRYFLDERGVVELYADKTAWQKAAQAIAIYKPALNRQSDFPLALLDQVAGPTNNGP